MTALPDRRNTQELSPAARLNVEEIRKDFPILHHCVYDKPLVYFDNAATTHKPKAVIDALTNFYNFQNANIHRGVHYLSQVATDAHDGARETVRSLLNAGDTSEIIFLRGTTEAINLVASSYGRERLGPGDEIVISGMEHHSNIVPWQMVREKTGCTLKVVPINDRGELDMTAYEQMLGPNTRIVAMVHVSNALGTINPAKRIVELAHAHDAVVLLDGAQAVAHQAVDVRDLNVDFYAFSGHKLFGPTGIGALYGKRALLDAMPPYQGGGDMIKYVTFERTVYNDPPFKFEAGTPDIAGPLGLAAAIDYVRSIGFDAISAYEAELLDHAQTELARLPGLRLIGTAENKASVASFVMDCAHPHDIGTILDTHGVAVRTGHHCAQPVMDRFGVPATTRASLAFYNTHSEVDALIVALRKVIEVFG